MKNCALQKAKLFYEKKNGLLKVDEDTIKAMQDYCEGYKH